jgi:hypothetical protein
MLDKPRRTEPQGDEDPFEGMFEALAEAAAEIVLRQMDARVEDLPGWLGTRSAAAYVDASIDAFNSMVARGEVPVHYFENGRRKFSPAELDALIS